MKKIVSFALTVILLLSISISSTAVQPTVLGSQNVTAGYVPGTQGGQVISVDIKWEGMEFTYNGASERVWDPEKHEYSTASNAAWVESNAYISVTNHSNVILQGSIDYRKNAGFESMDLAFTDIHPFIGSAETSDGTGAACEVIIRAIPMGELKPNTPAGTKVGEIKITVTPVEDYTAILDTFETIHQEIPVKDGNSIARGGIYFKTAADKNLVTDSFRDAKDAVNKPENSVPNKNLALNKLFAAYYNNIYLMQEPATVKAE